MKIFLILFIDNYTNYMAEENPKADHWSPNNLSALEKKMPFIYTVRRENDKSIKNLFKSSHIAMKNNIRLIKQINTEKNTAKLQLDKCTYNYMVLKRQSEEEKEKFQLDKENYKIQVKNLCNVADRLTEEVSEQRKKLEEQSSIFKYLQTNVMEIIQGFENTSVKANEKASIHEKKLQQLFGKCEKLLKPVVTKKTRLPRFSRNIFKTKRINESNTSV